MNLSEARVGLLSLHLALTATLGLYGCEAVSQLIALQDDSDRAREVLAEQQGWTAQVGYDWENGVLRNVQVTVSADEVRFEKVSSVESAVKAAVAKSFTQTPSVILMQIATSPTGSPVLIE